MKKIVTIVCALALSSQLFAGGKHDGVVALPHLMKIVLTHSEELSISSQQQEKLDEILATMPEKMHALMDEAADLEQQIKRSVLKEKKSFEQIKSNLDALAKLEYTITQKQINAINKVQNILTQEQYQAILKKIMEKMMMQKEGCK